MMEINLFNFIFVIILSLIYWLPIIFVIYNILQKNYLNYFYLLKFLIFNFILLFYNILYIILYSVYFFFKNYRFYGYYYSKFQTSKFYYKKKSIYFLFWRYLTIFIITYCYNLIIFVLNLCFIQFKKALYINNIYLFLCIFIKMQYYTSFIYQNYILFILNFFYKLNIYIIYHLFYCINIDIIFNIFKNWNIFNKLKYLEDPLGYRNKYLTLSLNFYKVFNNINIIKHIWYHFKSFKGLLKKVIFSYILYGTQQLNLFFDGEKNRGFRFLLFKVFLVNKIYIKSRLIFFFKLILYYLNLLFINIIYIIIISIIYLIYSITNFIIIFRYWILYFLILFLCIKYYWIIYYFLLLLYKHYMFSFPVIEIKETSRFFNFEWIDFRNYYNLIVYHNTLVDLAPFNNIIYNDLLNNLNKALSLYGFKITNEYDIALYSLLNINNKDTHLLNNLIGVYNQVDTYKEWQWYSALRKVHQNKAQLLFKPTKIISKSQGSLKPSLDAKLNHLADKEKLIIKKNVPFKSNANIKKLLSNYDFFNKHYFKRRLAPSSTVLNIMHYIKLKKIPLKYIHIYNNDSYDKNLYKIIDYTNKMCKKYSFVNLKKLKNKVLYFYNSWKQRNILEHYDFFFSQIYNYNKYKHKLEYKHNIPTFNWTSSRWKKKVPNEFMIDYVYLSSVEEDHPFETYKDLAKKKIAIKKNYKYIYIHKVFPYCTHLSNTNNSNIMEVLEYYNVLINNIKIVKKFYFLNNSKLAYNKKHYTMLLEYNKMLLNLFLTRLKMLDKPFIKGHLYDSTTKDYLNLNFWFFFDYLKVDKYYYLKYPTIYKENSSNVNLFYIKRIRKDYIKYRNSLMRLFSLYFYHYNLEYTLIKNFSPQFIAFDINKQIQEHFDSLKLSWYYNIYLTNDRKNINIFENVYFLSYLFKKKFWAYYIYCDYTINSHNKLYNIQINTYKLEVLTKISNLKRFFFFHNKNICNFSILKYINTFSLKFHIKHLLWHSPYSFLFYKNNLIINLENLNKSENYNFFYTYKKKIVSINKYSFIFNLLLNVVEIKKDWVYVILNNKNIINNIIFYNSFYNYYYNGKFNYKTLHYIDAYRVLISLIYYYYNNFLYKFARFHYILDYKKYTVYSFFKRYFNFSEKFWHQYIRIRLQIYRYLFYGKFMKKGYYEYFKLKNLYAFRARKITLMPFWFIFDSYIKLFIYFILKKYYTKTFFINYWFKNIINYNIIYFVLYFYNLQYFIYNLYLNLMFNCYYINKILNIFKLFIKDWFCIFFNYLLNFKINFIEIIKYNYIDWDEGEGIFIVLKQFIYSFIYLISKYISLVFNFSKIKLYIWFKLNLYDAYFNIKSIYIYYKLWFNKNVNLLYIQNYIKFYKRLFITFYMIIKLQILKNSIIFMYTQIEYIKWYITLIFQYHFNFTILWNWILKYTQIIVLIKFYFLSVNINIKFNKIILIKLYFEKLLIYYLTILFNVKNSLIYFKPNYYYFRKQRNYMNHFKVINAPFESTITWRSMHSFKHFTYNITFLKNIYLINIYNYIYLLNIYDITYDNIFNLLFFLFKYNYVYYSAIYYIVLYWSLLFFLFLYYKKFYNIFFFCNNVTNLNLQSNWNKIFNDDAIKMSLIHTKKKQKIYNIFWLKFKFYNFYTFYFSNIVFKKSKMQNNIYKGLLLSKLYINKMSKLFNNNNIIDLNKNDKLILDYPIYIYNYISLFKNWYILPFTLKKEKKKYNFTFLNLLNTNLLNFCWLYWVIIVPYFFFEYILIRYHLKGHLRTKRNFVIFFKIFLDNFKIYIKLFKLIGDGIYTDFKVRYPKNYYNTLLIRKKKKLRFGFFFKWDRYQQIVIRITPLGTYYYWFFNINRVEYFISYYKYFFVFSLFSNYFSYTYIYIFIIFIILKNYKIKFLKFNFILNKFNLFNYYK